MGNKRSCTCGCWSEVQQECLYTGSGCFYDDERKKPEVTEKWLDEKMVEFFKEFPNAMQKGSEIREFIRSLVEEILGK